MVNGLELDVELTMSDWENPVLNLDRQYLMIVLVSAVHEQHILLVGSQVETLMESILYYQKNMLGPAAPYFYQKLGCWRLH